MSKPKNNATTADRPRLLDSLRPKLELSPQVKLMIRLASACLFTYWLAIFLATHIPSSAMPKLAWSDKVYHAGAFAGLSYLLCWALPTRPGAHARLQQLTLAGLIAASYGCIDEFTQQFIPGRCCDIWDVAADCVGAVIGLVAYLACRQLLVQFAWGRQVIAKFAR